MGPLSPPRPSLRAALGLAGGAGPLSRLPFLSAARAALREAPRWKADAGWPAAAGSSRDGPSPVA